MKHQEKDILLQRIKIVFDIDVNNCTITNEEWATILVNACTNPEFFKNNIEREYNYLKQLNK
tara:strand:+ start:678 stop:863 length:186 start_codon:yes stop_codon:yes gene_type:complete